MLAGLVLKGGCFVYDERGSLVFVLRIDVSSRNNDVGLIITSRDCPHPVRSATEIVQYTTNFAFVPFRYRSVGAGQADTPPGFPAVRQWAVR